MNVGINDLPDKRAFTIANAKMVDRAYERNIQMAAWFLVASGNGGAIYRHQIMKGTTIWSSEDGAEKLVVTLEECDPSRAEALIDFDAHVALLRRSWSKPASESLRKILTQAEHVTPSSEWTREFQTLLRALDARCED
jgi:hypothetical protein